MTPGGLYKNTQKLSFCIERTETTQGISSREGVKLGGWVPIYWEGLEGHKRCLFHAEVREYGRQLQPLREKYPCLCLAATAPGTAPPPPSQLSAALGMPPRLEQTLASSFLFLLNLALVSPLGKTHQDPASKSPASRPLKYRGEPRWSNKRLDTNK